MNWLTLRKHFLWTSDQNREDAMYLTNFTIWLQAELVLFWTQNLSIYIDIYYRPQTKFGVM